MAGTPPTDKALKATCPRCPAALTRRSGRWSCAQHGSVVPLWVPREPSYVAFTSHLGTAGEFPTYLPWPVRPGWSVTDFGVVGEEPGAAVASVTCCSGTTDLDGPVDVFVIAEEPGTGLGARCARTVGDPGYETMGAKPTVRIGVDLLSVPLWAVSTSGSDAELDRSVVAGEAGGRWLWLVLRPASAMLLLHDAWRVSDVSGLGAPLLDLPFGGPRPGW